MHFGVFKAVYMRLMNILFKISWVCSWLTYPLHMVFNDFAGTGSIASACSMSRRKSFPCEENVLRLNLDSCCRFAQKNLNLPLGGKKDLENLSFKVEILPI